MLADRCCRRIASAPYDGPVDRRASAVGTVVAAVLVFAAAGYVLSSHTAVKDAGQIPSVGAGGYDSSRAPGTQPATGTTIAFLGDDYTAAAGASSVSQGFVQRIGQALSVRVTSFADPGGGYAKPSDSGRTYAALVDDLVKAHPDVVVVSGGRNDVGDFTPTLQKAVRTLFATLHTRLPAAVLVAVAPWWGDSPHPATLTPVTAAVKSGVQSVGGTFLGGSDPLRGHPGWMADAADPNDTGYAAIATALRRQLAPLLPGSGP